MNKITSPKSISRYGTVWVSQLLCFPAKRALGSMPAGSVRGAGSKRGPSSGSSKEPKAASFEESGTCTAPGGDEYGPLRGRSGETTSIRRARWRGDAKERGAKLEGKGCATLDCLLWTWLGGGGVAARWRETHDYSDAAAERVSCCPLHQRVTFFGIPCTNVQP